MHNNKEYKQRYIKNLEQVQERFKDETNRSYIGLSDDVGLNRIIETKENGIFVKTVEKNYGYGLQDIEGINYAESEIILFWTIDDLIVPETCVECYLKMRYESIVSCGGCRIQEGEDTTKISKLEIYNKNGIDKLYN